MFSPVLSVHVFSRVTTTGMVAEVWGPRESAEFIASRSKDVSIRLQGVETASSVIFQSLKSKKYSFKVWKEHELHPKAMADWTADWIFVLDSLNFSFWVEDHCAPWTVRFNGKDYTGYWALCAGINRALQVNTAPTHSNR